MSYLRGVTIRLKMDIGNRRLPWAAFLLLSLLVSSCSSRGQLIGSRGVFVLPEGQEYRDATTREASRSDMIEMEIKTQIRFLDSHQFSVSAMSRGLNKKYI